MQFDSPAQAGMLIAGIMILCWLMLRGKMGRRRTRQEIRDNSLRFKANATGHSQVFSGTQSLGAPPDALRWQVELHDLGRELKGELDSKMLAVQKLSRSYDQAANRLSELIRLAEQATACPNTPYAKVHQLSQAGWSPPRISSSLGLPLSDVELLLTPPTPHL